MRIAFMGDQPVIDAPDEDAARFRLTLYRAGKQMRLTCAKVGTVLCRIRADMGPT